MLGAAVQQQSDPGSVGAVYTMGGPMVGDASWAQAYSDLGLNDITSRYVAGRDPVPLLPPASKGFTHVGKLVRTVSCSAGCAYRQQQLLWCVHVKQECAVSIPAQYPASASPADHTGRRRLHAS